MSNNVKKNFFYTLGPLAIFYLMRNLITFPLAQFTMAKVMLDNPGANIDTITKVMLSLAQTPAYLIIINMLGELTAGIIFVVWILHLKRTETKDTVSLGGYKPLSLTLGIVLLAVGFQYAGNYMLMISSRLYPDVFLNYSDSMDSMGLNDGGMAFTLFMIYSICIAPIAEELAFRGISMTYARSRLGPWGANILVSILFASIHDSILQMVYTFIFGLVLGYIVIRTGKIWIAIVVHLCFNAASVPLSSYGFFGDTPLIHCLSIFFSLVAIYLGVCLVIKSAPNRE